ncbi:hypothetical protein [Sandaracinus amylolyticus]|uniref:TolB protein n=1 Tax=Sandaracinus amylolyticus TaxID=927083 RepID=A0A0F6W0V3_9BACT|nr:hypothetical protein [Sandaracinus amylolyticus]AKF04637.1 tolB protein precursor [Sandaracinus amylolyticus]
MLTRLRARAAFAGVLLAACSNDPVAPTLDASTGDAGDPNAVVAIRVEPERLELLSRDGEPASGTVRAIAIEADGDERPAEGITWILGSPSLATITPEGVATIDGSRGGESAVLARLDRGVTTIVGEGRLVARIERRTRGDLTDDEVARFDAEPVVDAAAAPRILYPLEGAVMPRNLRAPVVQWQPQTGDGDLYRVRARSTHVELVTYLRSSDTFEHSWTIAQERWRLLADADPDAPITFEIDRWQAAHERVVRGAAPVTMHVARGGVLGEVYYWALERGRILAIDPQTATPRDVVPNPPRADAGGQRCMACHTVSRNGRWLFGRRFDDDASWIVDLAEDTTTDPPPMRYEPRPGIDTASFDPTGERLLAAWEGRLFVVDARTGLEVASSGLPTTLASMPTWSPSGDLAAWIVADASESDAPSTLHVATREDADTSAFATSRALHAGADLSSAPEGGSRDALPSWTPDDRFLVFQHGAQAFTSGAPGARAALYLARVEDGHTARLDAASGGTDAFWPTVSPYVTDEADDRRFYWVAFHSRRDYGNARAGTWGRRIRQLWITAVDADPDDGVDASHPPVWLPGQERDYDNVAAYWAPESCRGGGQSCADGSECCSGECTDEGICTAPPI